MAEKSSFWSEFKTFIARGNVMDMAVGVVVGGAFTAIVNSLVGDIINPLIGKLFGGVDLSEAKVVLTEATEETAEVAIRYGSLIQTIINFIIVALCIFAVVRGINKLKDKMKKEEEAAEEEAKEEEPAEPSEEVLLLREIRDSLQK
ncbi:MAG: large-conductance mechanosensitive channel protein MscL [Clostridia bacterium]|nr:large-conductance mechanosensitive channel protein MscL [Clostridia bacterium]